jgi:hypothetical protein
MYTYIYNIYIYIIHYIHTCMHAYIQTYKHTYTNTHIQTYTHTHIHTYIQTMHTYILYIPCIHTIHTIHAMHAACMHAYIHTHTDTHTRSYISFWVTSADSNVAPPAAVSLSFGQGRPWSSRVSVRAPGCRCSSSTLAQVAEEKWDSGRSWGILGDSGGFHRRYHGHMKLPDM